ncbi:hypothetical protein BBO99_00009152, partial [Phytophthora kernoviae]
NPAEYTKEITDEDEIKKIILKKIVDDMMLLDKDLIRETNKIDLYDLSSLRNVTIDIERKGLEAIEVNDYANYVILTNNDFGSIIEANDRRYMCLIASESRVGDEKYFDRYFNTLANLDDGCDIFHYLACVGLTGFKPQAFPLTK